MVAVSELDEVMVKVPDVTTPVVVLVDVGVMLLIYHRPAYAEVGTTTGRDEAVSESSVTTFVLPVVVQVFCTGLM